MGWKQLFVSGDQEHLLGKIAGRWSDDQGSFRRLYREDAKRIATELWFGIIHVFCVCVVCMCVGMPKCRKPVLTHHVTADDR